MRSQLVVKSLSLIILFIATVVVSGCSTLESFISAQNSPPGDTGHIETPAHQTGIERFSDNPNMIPPTARQYRRMTKSQMEDESELHSQAGSMWNSEGQGAYLFTQNKTRREGDLLNVKLEGPGQKQVETKVGVIKKLLKQLEEQEAEKAAVEAGGLAANQTKDEANRGPASIGSGAGANNAAPKVEKEEKEEPLDIGPIPARIVERSPDGNYRVKGAQPFMIGKREYKVILTGIIRPEDFNDEGVGSNKVIDPQYDVVSLRRNQ